MSSDHDVELAVLTERFDQLRADHLALSKSIRELSQTVAQLERTVAAQSPLTAMFERFVIALVTGAVTYFITKEAR
jgi:prefoldin subunit 5